MVDNDWGGNDNDSRSQGWDWEQQDNPSQNQSEALNWMTGSDLEDGWGTAENNDSQTSTANEIDGLEEKSNEKDQNPKTGQVGSLTSKSKTVDLVGWGMALVGGLLHPVEALLEVYESCLDKLDPLALAARWVEAEV